MTMIPDDRPPTKPTETWRVDFCTNRTEAHSVIFNATEAGVKDEAWRIVTEQGGALFGDVYRLDGSDRGSYHTTVPLPMTPWPGLSAHELECWAQSDADVTLGDVLAAVVAGAHTEQQMTDRFGHPMRGPLTRLLCGGLLFMQVIDAQWHYKPTKKGRAMNKARHGGAS